MPLETSIAVTAVCVCAYLVGAIPFGYLIGKINGVDIRRCGSGNIGATNVTRVVGKWWGRLCFLLDFLKGVLPVFAAGLLVRKGFLTDSMGILPCLAAFGAVCGHIWPLYLGFRGGKGISTAAGAIFALNPPALISAGVLWVMVFFLTRYVSLASVCAALSLPLFCVLYLHLGLFTPPSLAEKVLFCLLAVLTVVKHSSNIKRLLNGTENRFGKPTKKDTDH